MARRRSKNSRNRAIPLRSLPVVRFRPRAVSPFRPYDAFAGKMTVLEDRRTFHPQRALRPAFSLPRSAARLVVRDPKKRRAFLAQTRAVVAFADPRRVLICLRRKARREVLMALGGGGGGKRKPRRNEHSDVRC